MENIGKHGRRPDWIVKSVVDTGKLGEDGKPLSRWRELGVAFNNEKSGTITVLLDALPAGDKPKLVLAQPKEQEQLPVQPALQPPVPQRGQQGFQRRY